MIEKFTSSELLSPFESLSIIGKRRNNFFKRLCKGERFFDLLSLLPSQILQRNRIDELSPEYENCLVTLKVIVDYHEPSKGFSKRAPYKIHCYTPCHNIELVFFNSYQTYLKKKAPQGSEILVSGKLTLASRTREKSFQIIHPDYMGAFSPDWEGVEPIYPLTAGLTQAIVRKALDDTLNRLPLIPEWISLETLKKFNLPHWQEALLTAHNPKSVEDLKAHTKARMRLSYDEFFAHQLAHRLSAPPVESTYMIDSSSKMEDSILERFYKLLPFELTGHQKQAIHEIFSDMARTSPMHRLLQGDVGSGKTLVALAACIKAIENGYQAAFLVPTDILARQHFSTLQKYCKNLSLNVELLTAQEKGKKRKLLLENLKEGNIHLLLGTHALLENYVEFHNLGLAVIDEQHRFGVEQRLNLCQKGKNPHLLSMTATPIPRTLLLSNYGEMSVSFLKEKPPGRKPVTTKTVSCERFLEVIPLIKKYIERGEKIFWVCPLIEESEKLDLAAATIRFESLQEYFSPESVILTHGKQKPIEKEAAMNAFAHGNAHILVSTTVIEVGVDVPKATLMIIEHAERFGLAQLHQLRGRIGRGNQEGLCILLYGKQLSQTAYKRLHMMKTTHDGFVLAEADLRLRGGGEILGVRQSGLPQYRFASPLSEDDQVYQCMQELLEQASQDAIHLLTKDPKLETLQGQAAQFLLKLFNLENINLLKRSG